MRPLLLALFLPLLAGGCASMEQSDATEEAEVIEKEARALEAEGKLNDAAVRYSKSEERYAHARGIAIEREDDVFIRYLTTKLAYVLEKEAHLVTPDRNPDGSWNKAIAYHEEAAKIARAGKILKIERNALSGKAYCLEPTRNPKGSWEQCVKLYEKAAALSERFDDKEGRGKALVSQALAMLQGKKKKPTAKVRELLEEARKAGNQEAAKWLGGASARYCTHCGGELGEGARFCPSCGKGQTARCVNCGQELDGKARFCPGCGQKRE